MNFGQYQYIIKNVSSEMFYSLMSLLHSKLPCASGYFRLRKTFGVTQRKKSSNKLVFGIIAQPSMINGLSFNKKNMYKSMQIKNPAFNKNLKVKSQ